MTQGNSIAGPQRVGQEQPNTPPGNVDPRLVTAERIVVTGPQYHKGRLTHEGMRQVHAAGGSVLHNGIVIPPGAPLPSAEDLAGTDQAALDAAEDQLAVEETRLAQRRSRLAQQRKAADEAAKLEAEQQKKQQQTAAPDDLEAMKVAELREQAKAAGVQGASSMSKHELVDALAKQQQVNSGNLDVLTVAELKERANAAGIQGASGMNKAELVAALNKQPK